jgi:hypothetical protein
MSVLKLFEMNPCTKTVFKLWIKGNIRAFQLNIIMFLVVSFFFWV